MTATPVTISITAAFYVQDRVKANPAFTETLHVVGVSSFGLVTFSDGTEGWLNVEGLGSEVPKTSLYAPQRWLDLPDQYVAAYSDYATYWRGRNDVAAASRPALSAERVAELNAQLAHSEEVTRKAMAARTLN